MRKAFILMILASMTFSACIKMGKSEEEIRKEVEDSIRLAKAEERARLAEQRYNNAIQNNNTQAPAPAPAPAPKATTPAPSSSQGKNSGNPYAWLSQRYVTDSDLAGCSGSQLRIMRNAIYARHGYIFQSADLRQYFSQFSWYVPRYSNVENMLSSLERDNILTIKSWE